jgi:hypothetical protein
MRMCALLRARSYSCKLRPYDDFPQARAEARLHDGRRPAEGNREGDPGQRRRRCDASGGNQKRRVGLGRGRAAGGEEAKGCGDGDREGVAPLSIT